MKRISGWLLLLTLFSMTAWSEHDSSRWEDEIQHFEENDKTDPPPQNGVLFIGSSSIRFWDLDEFFPNLPAINRGFGGSQIADSINFADRILVPYHPKAVVFYAGDNDIAAGKSPEEVFQDYKTFAGIVAEELPGTRLLYIAIKPSLSRWNLVDRMREANRLIQEETEKHEDQTFIDIDAPMLGDDGKPRKELFLEDGLHLTNKGYEIWSDLVRKSLEE